MSDSTPPSDSASVNSSVAAQTRSAASRPPAQPDGDHAAEAAHLLGRDLVARVLGQARVVHLRDRGCPVRNCDHPLGVVAVPFHAHGEGLHAAQGEPRVERAGHRAHGVLGEAELLGELVVGGDQRAADDVGVAADVLGGGVQHDVGAERERRLQVRRGERVVDDEPGPGLVGDVGQRRRCRRCPAAGWWASRTRSARVSGRSAARSAVDVGEVDGRVLDAPRPEHLVDQPERAAVRVVPGSRCGRPARSSARSSDVGGRHPGPERDARAARPPARRGTPAARCGWGWRCGEYS